MVALNGNVLLDLDIVDAFQDRQPVAHACNPHLLQVVVLQGYQGLSDNLVL